MVVNRSLLEASGGCARKAHAIKQLPVARAPACRSLRPRRLLQAWHCLADARSRSLNLAWETAMPRPASAPISYTTLADAVAHGDPIALHDQAREMEKDDRFEEAAHGYESAFAKGSIISGYRLAKMYEKGKGFAVDLRQARRLTEWAAMSGNIKAIERSAGLPSIYSLV